jgi:hypothetical protein
MIMKRLLAAIGLGALAVGCGKTNEAFDQLRQASMQELQLKTQAATGWGFGKFDRWDFDQNVGLLVFSNADGYMAKCPAQIVGTYDSSVGSWQWAWADPSIDDKLKADSLRVKDYGATNGFEKLTEAEWQGTETDAWEMAAITCKICGDQCVYRGPASDTLFVFFSFGPVQLSKGK